MLPSVLGVIPARGGSKRVPGKNLRLLLGRPLIAHTLHAAMGAKRISELVVSTEDCRIKDVALSYGVKVVHRPSELADDNVDSGLVCVHALKTCGRHDLVALLHPTSPIRDARHIDGAIDMLWASKAPALASVECRKRCYRHNASIYVMRSDWLLRTWKHYCDESIPFLMDARHSVDIDTEDDFRIAECLMSK